MADVRCPMCGKLNPAGLDVCQFCQARLKPVKGSSATQGERPASSQPSTQNGEPAEDSALPDWLQSLRQRQESLPEAAEPLEDVPDWLSNLRAPSEETTSTAEDAVPDWLSGISLDAPSGGEIAPAEPEQVFFSEEEPDWLSKIGPSQPAEPPEPLDQVTPEAADSNLVEPLPEESPIQNEGETPEWLKGPSEEPGGAAGQTAVPTWEQEGQLEATGVPAETQDELPAWMAGILARQATGPEPAHAGPEIPLAALGAAALAQPAGESPAPVQESQPKGVEPFSSKEGLLAELGALDTGELPAWLAGLTPLETEKQEPAPQAAPADSSLAPSDELPSWLEAMRPVESAVILAAMSDLSHETIESAGPLSGLRGVLPAEPGVAQGQKPHVHSIKLQISETNQANAVLIEQMIKTEGQARPVVRRSVITTQRVLRIVIAVVLILVVLWPLVTGSPQASLPGFTPEAFATNQLIEGLSAGAPVLLAFDYQPGLSGEMDAAAAGVIDHLMVKGAYLAVISTASTGSAQAERLLAMVSQTGQHNFASPDQYINLGFIPGGPTGLLSFAQSPSQAMPLALDGNSPWQGTPLEDVTAVKDFALTIVITDNPDDARAWVEQVGPALENQPLTMVISAQAEPMVRPYVETNPPQISGLVIGLPGGASYEDLNGRMGIGQTYWNAFCLGLVAAVVLILVGGLVTAGSAVFAHTKETEGEKKA